MQPNHEQIKWIKAAVFIACLTPLARLAWMGASNRLGANPIEHITRSTGWWTLAFLLITLSITPARRLLDQPWLLRLRRMLGLFAFFHASLHFTTYLWLDQFFDWMGIVKDIGKRPFITVGFAALAMLIPLAATSTNAMVRRLGAKRWQRLHRLVYVIAVAGAIHFWWLVKKDITEPAVFAGTLGLLFGIRLLYLLRRKRLSSAAMATRSPAG